MNDFFIAVDVETANASRASICQLGLVACLGEGEVWRWGTLVNPEEAFERANFDVHGIHPRAADIAPTFPEFYPSLLPSLTGQYLCSWSPFDQDAIAQVCQKYGLQELDATWLDAQVLARAAWPHLQSTKLANVAQYLGLEYQQHDAVADACACAIVVSRALSLTNSTVGYWAQQQGRRTPITYQGPKPVLCPVKFSRAGRSDGPLAGHVVLFTGDFGERRPKLEAWAAERGCDVKTGFSRKITVLVVGGFESKTQKLMAAEEARANGQPVEIVTEEVFNSWLKACG